MGCGTDLYDGPACRDALKTVRSQTLPHSKMPLTEALSQSEFWRRTWFDRSYDFVFIRDGVTVGRIYRHHDQKRWQWFRQHPTGESGVCDSKTKAARAIDGKE